MANETRDEGASQDRGQFSDRNSGNSGFDRPMVEGDWKCSECGTAITQLPFAPSGDRPIFCRDCYRNKRPPRRDFRR
ncbi:MAG: CxxC-x17-CxxC domain-containing protein [Patescibacteria group bacterium]